MARLYSDEHFSFRVVEELRRLGHDVVTIQERGWANLGVPDDAVLEFAHVEGRALLTQNRWDFIRLHNQGKEHAGIIACTIDFDDIALALRIHRQIVTHTDFSRQLIRIYRPS